MAHSEPATVNTQNRHNEVAYVHTHTHSQRQIQAPCLLLGGEWTSTLPLHSTVEVGLTLPPTYALKLVLSHAGLGTRL